MMIMISLPDRFCCKHLCLVANDHLEVHMDTQDTDPQSFQPLGDPREGHHELWQGNF